MDRKTAGDLVTSVFTGFDNNSSREEIKQCFYSSLGEQYKNMEQYYDLFMKKYGFDAP